MTYHSSDLPKKLPVSVIIPCYCCEGTIERAVNSVMDQVALPSEIFLVDDASPDNGKTLKKLQEIKDKFRSGIQIHIIAQSSNKGPAAARNLAWNIATQPYIAFLDSDDAWFPHKLDIQYGWMASHDYVSISGHHTEFVDQSERPPDVQLPREWSSEDINEKKLLKRNYFLTRSVMLKRTLPFRFNEKKRYCEDYDLWLRIVFAEYKAVFLNVMLGCEFKAAFRGGGLSSHLWKMECGELECYWELFSRNNISAIQMFSLGIYSFIKYIRRLFLSIF